MGGLVFTTHRTGTRQVKLGATPTSSTLLKKKNVISWKFSKSCSKNKKNKNRNRNTLKRRSPKKAKSPKGRAGDVNSYLSVKLNLRV